jgi:hypothetical protein
MASHAASPMRAAPATSTTPSALPPGSRAPIVKDWVTVDELDLEMHFPKEGVVLSRESRSSKKFMHGVKVLMAKNYIDNLSEEARKCHSACNIDPLSRGIGVQN